MNGKVIAGLSAATLVILVLGFSLSKKEEPASDISKAAESGPLFPALANGANDVDKIQVFDSTTSITLVRAEDNWVLPAVANYPVKLDSVRDAISKIARMEIAEKKTANPEYFEQLGLNEPGKGEGAGSEVLLYKNGEKLADVILGKPEYQAFPDPHQYVRKQGENQTWLVKGNLTPQTRESNWIDQEFLKVANSRAETVSYEKKGGDKFSVHRDTAVEKFALDSIPEGKQLKTETVLSETGSLMASLRFDDVKPRAELPLTDDNLLSKTTVETFDGLEVAAARHQVGEKKWVVFQAKALEDKIDKTNAQRTQETEALNKSIAAKERPEGEEAPPPTKPDLIDKDAIVKEAEEMNKSFEKYAYTLQSYYDDRLGRTKDYYLKDEEKPPADGPPPPAAEGPPAESAMPGGAAMPNLINQ